MMTEIDPEEILEEARVALEKKTNLIRNKLWRKMHALAEMQYIPAIDFFMKCLESSDDNWRLEGLQDIGFHYQFDANSDITKKIRQMLLNDPDDSVRLAAASVLGIRSQWPDKTLLKSVKSDRDKLVRTAAFRAILKLVGVPYVPINTIMRTVDAGEIPLNVNGLRHVFLELDITVDLPDD